MAGLEHNGGSLRGALSAPPRVWLQPLALDEAGPWAISEAEQAWSAVLPPAVQQRYRASRHHLRARLAELLQLRPEAVPLHSPPGQAPALEQGLGCVSLSHSRDQLLLAWSPWAIGVDLEWQQRRIQAELLARRFFPPQEWLQLQRLTPPQRAAQVLESWVRKEAAIKWQRSSLASNLRHWRWCADRQRLEHLLEGWQPRSVCERRNGWLCAVVGQAAEQTIWG
jgi:phosphopantetheinyl transferase